MSTKRIRLKNDTDVPIVLESGESRDFYGEMEILRGTVDRNRVFKVTDNE